MGRGAAWVKRQEFPNTETQTSRDPGTREVERRRSPIMAVTGISAHTRDVASGTKKLAADCDHNMRSYLASAPIQTSTDAQV